MSSSAWQPSVPSEDDHDKTSTRPPSPEEENEGTMMDDSQPNGVDENNYFKCRNHYGTILGYTTSRVIARLWLGLSPMYMVESYNYAHNEIKRQKRAAGKDLKQAVWVDHTGETHKKASFDNMTWPLQLILSHELYKREQAENPEEYESKVTEEDMQLLVNSVIARSQQLIPPEVLAQLEAEHSNPPAPDSSDDEAPASPLAA